MLSELERHLREADEDGKPVETVVGENVKEFAASWAKEQRPPRELGKRLLILISCLAIAVPVFAALTHLWFWTLSFDVDLFPILSIWVFALSIASASGLFPALAVLEHLKPRWKRNLGVVVLSAATVLVPVGIVALMFGKNAMLFHWSWSATLISMVVALLVYRIRKHVVPDVRAFAQSRTQ